MAANADGSTGHTFDVASWDRAEFARREFLSSDVVDWPAVLLEEVASNPNVDDAVIPASADYQVALVVAGNATIESFHERGWRRAAYVPGQISMTRPGRPALVRWRSLPAEAPRTLHAVIPNETMTAALEQLTDGRADPDSMPDYLAISDPFIAASLLALRRAASARLDPLYAEAAAWNLAVHVLAEHRREPVVDIVVDDRRIALAMDFVRDHLDSMITLAEMAAVAQLSPFHFTRTFKAATGHTPYQYVNTVRLMTARRLLSTSRARVSDVAQMCGYSSPSHFAAAFRRRFGLSPTDYRTEVREV